MHQTKEEIAKLLSKVWQASDEKWLIDHAKTINYLELRQDEALKYREYITELDQNILEYKTQLHKYIIGVFVIMIFICSCYYSNNKDSNDIAFKVLNIFCELLTLAATILGGFGYVIASKWVRRRNDIDYTNESVQKFNHIMLETRKLYAVLYATIVIILGTILKIGILIIY